VYPRGALSKRVLASDTAAVTCMHAALCETQVDLVLGRPGPPAVLPFQACLQEDADKRQQHNGRESQRGLVKCTGLPADTLQISPGCMHERLRDAQGHPTFLAGACKAGI
jgi:hypothetical protein